MPEDARAPVVPIYYKKEALRLDGKCRCKDYGVNRLAAIGLIPIFFAALIVAAIFANAFVPHQAYAANSTNSERIAQIAEREYNSTPDHQKGGEKYWSWGGEKSRVQWCSYFASWCAHEAGLMDAGIYPNNRKIYRNAQRITEFYRDNRKTNGVIWKNDKTYIPRRGDLAMTVNEKGEASHSAIVVSFRDGKVHTIGGNGDNDDIKKNAQPLGELWAYFITPSYGTMQTLSISHAKITGVKNKIYDGKNKYQSPNDVKVVVGGNVVQGGGYGLAFEYFDYSQSTGATKNAYKLPTAGKGISFYIRGSGSCSGNTSTKRYKITAVKAFVLHKLVNGANEHRITRSEATKKKLLSSGYTLKATMATRLNSSKPVYEYYNSKLKLHRYTFDSKIGKRLVACGYKKGGIVAYSDPTAYQDNTGKLYAVNHVNKRCKNDSSRFECLAASYGYGSLAEADKMRKPSGLIRFYEMIEYVTTLTWN